MKVSATPTGENWRLTFTEGDATVNKHLRTFGLTKGEIGYGIRKAILEAERDFAYQIGGDAGLEALLREQKSFFGTEITDKHRDLIVDVLKVIS